MNYGRVAKYRHFYIQSRRAKPERHEGGFMSKAGPTILFDQNFTLQHEYMLEFINYCRMWAKELYAIDKRISLKFIMWKNEQRAEFMWQGCPFIHIRPSTLSLEGGMRCTQDLIRETFNSRCCNWVREDRMLQEAFLPNLKFVISMEVEKLQQKLKEFDELTLSAESPQFTQT